MSSPPCIPRYNAWAGVDNFVTLTARKRCQSPSLPACLTMILALSPFFKAKTWDNVLLKAPSRSLCRRT